MPDAHIRNQIVQLVLTNLRELIRDKMNFFFVMVFPFLFIFLFLFISLTGGKNAPAGYDPLRYSLPGVLVMAFASLGLFGLATPLINQRQRGTLRLLGLTPLSPLIYVLAQIIARLFIALAQLVIILIVSYFIAGGIPLGNLPGIFLSALLGITMLFALSYLLGAIIPSPEAAGGILGGTLAPILMFTGILLPFSIMPPIILKIARFIPITYLGDALRLQILSEPSIASLWIDNLVLFGASLLFILLATRLFHWTEPEGRSRPARSTNKNVKTASAD